MKTIKRTPIFYKLTQQQKEWLNTNCCPICGLSKDQWKRRIDWRCCSKSCTEKYSEIVVFVWQEFRLKVFRRDFYTCIKCGFQARKEQIITSDSREWYNKHYIIFNEIIDENQNIKVILGQPEALVADHIIPIAIGGKNMNYLMFKHFVQIVIELKLERT